MKGVPSYSGLVLLCCLFFSRKSMAQLEKIYLNPKATGSAKQSQFVDTIQFIPLEHREGVQVVSNPYIIITDHNFIIADYSNKEVLFYSKKGHFLKKISYKKTGFGFPKYDERANQIYFYGFNKNYTLNTLDQIQIKTDWNDPRNKKYFKRYVIDLGDTSFTLKKDVPTQNDVSGASPFYGDYYWQGQITTSSLYKDSLDYEIKIYKNDKLVKSFFPYNRINEPKFLFSQTESASYSETQPGNTFLITRPYCDTIYRMTGDSLFPAYQLVTPLENTLPSSFFTKRFKNKTERENFRITNGWLFHKIYVTHETSTFLFLTVSYLYNNESYIYYKPTGTTYKTKNIKGEASQYNLSLLADFNTFQKGDWFYKTRNAGELTAFFENNKNEPIPNELESFIKSNPPSDAQVIIAFKFKD